MKIIHDGDHYINLLRSGNQKGFEYFFDMYYPELVRYAFTFTKNLNSAEDQASEVFISLWEKRDQFDNIFGVRAFLYVCVKNRSLSIIRKNKTITKYKNEVIYLNSNYEESALERMISKERIEETLSAISILPKGCQQVMRMIYLEGKSYKEIAKELNLSINTIRGQRGRGIMLIKKHLLTALLFTSIYN